MESPAEGAARDRTEPEGDAVVDEPGDPVTEPAAGRAAERAPQARRSLWKEIPVLVVIALVLALLIKTFLVQAFSIPSDSMQNTLQRGDRVLVDKLTPWFGSTPERGDVVVFHDPGGWLTSADTPPTTSNPVLRDLQSALSTVGLMPSANEKDLIKRVIAVGGDTVQCDRGAPVKVNGVALNEPYLYPGATPCDDDTVGTVTVPKGSLWVMGDHRDDSWDSRHQRLEGNGGGFVPVGDVIGRAFVVAWPLDRWSVLSVPSTFGQKGLAASAALPAAPSALGGLAGAVPLTLWYRRRRR